MVGVSSVPFHRTLEVDTKPVPVTVRLTGALLTGALLGLRPFVMLMVGPAIMVKVPGREGSPVGFLTVT